MAERGRLLSGYRGKTRSGVRIPPSPQETARSGFFYYEEGNPRPLTGINLLEGEPLGDSTFCYAHGNRGFALRIEPGRAIRRRGKHFGD